MLVLSFFLLSIDWRWLEPDRVAEFPFADRDDLDFGIPLDLDCDAEGNIYLVDNKTASITVISPAGELLFSFGRKGQGPGELERPFDLIVDRQRSRVWVTDLNGTVTRFDTEGTFQARYPLIKPAYSLACRSDGMLFVGGKRDNHLEIYDAEMNLVRSFGTSLRESLDKSGLITTFIHLAVDGEDHLYVAYSYSPLIEKYDREGRLLWQRERPWVNPEQEPWQEKGKRGSLYNDNIMIMDDTIFLGTREEGAIVAMDAATGAYLGFQATPFYIRGMTHFGGVIYSSSTKDGGAFRIHDLDDPLTTKLTISPSFENRYRVSDSAIIGSAPKVPLPKETAPSNDGCGCGCGGVTIKTGKEQCASSCCAKK